MQPFKFRRHISLAAILMLGCQFFAIAQERDSNSLTPRQLEIEKLRVRLGSADVEEKRDALTRLGTLHHPDASRAAVSALSDPLPIIRATAATSILSLPSDEAATNLLPLLADKDEFVRRETCYALGKTRSRLAVPKLSELLLTDKEDGVRGAAAVALGEIGDSAGLVPLAGVLNPQLAATSSSKKKKSRREQNPFVLRSAARALGQIGNRAGSTALMMVLADEKAEDDLRREAAIALGRIGDAASLPALRAALSSRDPYLALAANEAIRRISNSTAP